jgi:hypothetical protein
MNVYLVMKHPERHYQRGAHTEAGTVEKALSDRKTAQDFVDEKNKRAKCSFWSVKAKKVDGS